MPAFALRVRLDPAPEHRAQLLAYPARGLWPDFAVVTSGALALDLGPRAVAYRRGRWVTLPAGADDPAVWLPDYLGGFLPRLARAVLDLTPGRPTLAHLLDAPAALEFVAHPDQLATVRFLEQGHPLASAIVPLHVARAAVAAALATFLADLLAINPRLAAHPEVADLHDLQAALAATA
jgi:hypothetical protein